MTVRYSWLAAACLLCLTTGKLSGAQPLTLQKGFLFLDRSDANACDIFVDNGLNDIVDAEDFDLGMDVGGKWNIQWEFQEGYSFVGEYFGVDWNDSLQATGSTGVHVNNNGFGLQGDVAATDLSTTLDSDLHSVLIGIRKQVTDCIAIQASARRISLDDSLFGAISTGGIIDGAYRAITDNDLTGFHLGIDTLLLQHGRKRVSVNTGFGVYDNNLDHYAYYNGGGGLLLYADEGHQTSWSYDLNVDCSYQLTNWLSLGVGYQLLYLDGLALGTDQALFTNFAGMQGTNKDSDVLFQGINLFTECRF